MLKKIFVFSTIIFLLFEITFYDSNKSVDRLNSREDKLSVYRLAINEDRETFINDYKDIILDEEDNDIVILISENDFEKIKEKYLVTIVK